MGAVVYCQMVGKEIVMSWAEKTSTVAHTKENTFNIPFPDPKDTNIHNSMHNLSYSTKKLTALMAYFDWLIDWLIILFKTR